VVTGSDDPDELRYRRSKPFALEQVERSFFIDRFEVTIPSYRRCIEAGPCAVPHGSGLCFYFYEGTPGRASTIARWGLEGDHPINCVSAFDADAYCAWKGARLPTVRERTLAARGPANLDGPCEGPQDLAMRCNKRRFPWGEDRDPRRANVSVVDGLGERSWRALSTTPVGFFDGSPRQTSQDPPYQTLDGSSIYGVHDLIGNLNEWSADSSGEKRIVFDHYFDSPYPWDSLATSPGDTPSISTEATGIRCARDSR